MKKLLTGVTSAVLAATMLFGFVGCGAKSIKGEEVTEEQWKNAFSELEQCNEFDMQISVNVVCDTTLDFRASGGEKLSGKYKNTMEISATERNNKEFLKQVTETTFSGDMKFINEYLNYRQEETEKDTEEMYAQKIGDSKYTIYRKNSDGEWQTTESGSDAIRLSSMLGEVVGYVSLNYADYEYDASEKGYVPKTPDEDDERQIVIKFDKDGRFCALYYKGVQTTYKVNNDPVYAVESEYSVIVDFVLKYTAKEIELPQVSAKE